MNNDDCRVNNFILLSKKFSAIYSRRLMFQDARDPKGIPYR